MSTRGLEAAGRGRRAPVPREGDHHGERNYLTTYLRDFETALYGANFTDLDSGYAKYIDVMSFIDHHIMVELTKNIDGFRLSTYMFKDCEDCSTWGPSGTTPFLATRIT